MLSILRHSPLMVEIYRPELGGYIEALVEVTPGAEFGETWFSASLEDGAEVQLTGQEEMRLAAELHGLRVEAAE
jgi:hypothetical protein